MRLNPNDLLEIAEALLSLSRKQAYLRRSISTTYYALFHTIANCCADSLIGTGTLPDLSRSAWRNVYRAVDHSRARSQCERVRQLGFPPRIIEFADLFVTMQRKRHEADYDPYARLYKSECTSHVRDARSSITAFCAQPNHDRRAFASIILIQNRNR